MSSGRHDIIKFFKENPDQFVEQYFGLRLLPYQKAFLKLSVKNDNYLLIGRKIGLDFSTFLSLKKDIKV